MMKSQVSFVLFLLIASMVSLRGEVSGTPEIRTFTRASDQKALEAFVVSYEGELVTLQVAGNKTFELEPSIFVEEDQAYLADWLLKSRGMPSADEIDPRVVPGAEFRVEVDGISSTKQRKPGGFTIRIPESYVYPEPIPIFVFINGGPAAEKLQTPKGMVDASEWVLVALPFPEEVSTESPISSADLPASNVMPIEGYHEALLAEVERLVPNLSPHVRMIGGVSNGAHTLGCGFHFGWGCHLDRFETFVLWEGGGTVKVTPDYKAVAKLDKLIWVGEGAKGTKPNVNTFMESVQRRMEESKVDFTYEVIQSSPHNANDEAMEAMRKWIEEVAVPHMEGLSEDE